MTGRLRRQSARVTIVHTGRLTRAGPTFRGKGQVHGVNEDADMETCGEGMRPATVRVSVVIRETAR